MKPFKLLIYGYLGLSVITALFLMLPIATVSSESQPILDVFFTAFAAVTTAGLSLVDTATYYSLFGELVILTVIQICGVGYMFFISLALLGAFGRVDLNAKIILKDAMNAQSLSETLKVLRATLIFTIMFEITGAIILFFAWRGEMGNGSAIYNAIFHSISAFATAGYSSIEGGLLAYGHNPVVIITISILSIAGGLGFIVLYNLSELIFKKDKKLGVHILSTHTKLVLKLTATIFTVGFITYFLSELRTTGFSFAAMTDAFFQVVSASTTVGFNTVDVAKLTDTTLFILALLMFVGASPGSTGGGIKTTTLGVLGVYTLTALREKHEVNIMKREVKTEIVRKSIVIFLLSLFWVIFSAFMLSIFEEIRFFKLLIESIAAFGAGGISAGITEQLTPAGKIIVLITMFVGRVGPISMGLFMAGVGKESNIKYPDAGILVG